MLTRSEENYLKLILLLKAKHGMARSVDVAAELGVTKPSVSVAMKKLRQKGLVYMDEYHMLHLTAEGQRIAVSVFDKHMVIERYLKDHIGVGQNTAHQDACRLEHLVSNETLAKMKEHCDAKPE